MQEVNRLAVDLGRELRKGVESCLVRPPVVPGAPVLRQSLQVIDGHAAFPANASKLARPASAVQPFGEIVNGSLWDIDAERRNALAVQRRGLRRVRAVRIDHFLLLARGRKDPSSIWCRGNAQDRVTSRQ